MLYDLSDGLPEELAAHETLYFLGVGGPEDASGIGDVTSFAWRFALVEATDDPPVALAFSAMPRLMSFTRTVNGRSPFTVPTEVWRAAPAMLAGGAAVRVALNPSPETFDRLCAGGTLVERPVPALYGGGPT